MSSLADSRTFLTTTIQSARPLLGTKSLTTGLTTAAILLFCWTITDYIAWIRLGTGGTPPTPLSYLQMSLLRLNQLLSSNNLRDASSFSSSGPSHLPSALPRRSGPAPASIGRTMPQRQRPSPLPPAIIARTHNLITALHAAHPSLLELAPSKTEGGSTAAIYARADLPTLNPVARHRILDREIAHVHRQEQSLHVWLSEADAKEVVGKGWGQRFPMAEEVVPRGWTHVFAPRTEKECEVVKGIVKAGVAWVSGVEV
ncbi:hypothetical protein EV356DRAFT_497989 [Viridothelium virens]|uniref:Luciferase domain-containing protein n=1 Tax=Viridothelium virens TaxID=1048519 RepID=A0A6A6GSU9_VIRVR|nr:hypothetical protein EV356DRAFT_497989 [Viridothelium virens]